MRTISKESKAALVTFFFAVGLALLISYLFVLMACYIGILFTGLDSFFTIFVGTVVCLVVVAITATIFKRKAKQFTRRILLTDVTITACIVVGLLSWFQTRSFLKRCFIDPVPSSLQVHHGRSVLFATYVHFSAPPEVIAAIIQSKELAPPDDSQQIEQERSRVSWDWWKPATMANPKFYMRHHTSEAVQGWMQGLWVNDKTNEVYAYIKD